MLINNLPISSKSSIKHKLMKMSMVTNIIAIFIACTIFIFYAIINTKDMVINELYLVSQIISNRAGPAIDWGDKQTATDSLSDLEIKDSIIIACIYDKSGSVFASYKATPKAECPVSVSKGIVKIAWNRLSVYSDIVFHSNYVGTVYIETDIRDIISKIPNYIGFGFYLLFLIAIIAYIISSYYQKFITSPILNLVATTRDVITNDHYNSRATKFDDDEIGTLSESFNEMLMEIENRDKALKEINETLEEKVHERTKDLEEAKIKAEAANASKSEFLRNMSHELRTPLHGMTNMSKFGMDDIDKNKAELKNLRMYFSKISQVTTRLTELVDGVLNISRMENGSEEFIMEPATLLDIFDVVIAEQQSALQLKSINLKYNKPEFNTEITCHRGKIIQVLTNIISNAIKFSPMNQELILSAEHSEDFITVVVQDNGPGIPESELETIFEKFVQSTRTKTGAGGTGLGLAICKGIILGHDGKIWAENNPNGGSIFKFTISTKIPKGRKIVKPNVL